ncbi:MAG: LPS export ABC transporter permease LptG [Thiobacillaceae bacterium]|jgi:lipopolysaccharide export system permease protein|nr:LPS export ABC transporter permease LptG [Thiobacillaceae bacterium]
MSILARYLGREILGAIAMALTALLLLYSFLDFIREIDDLSSSYTLLGALLQILLGIPTHVQELLPVATIIGALFALTRLATQSEFTVMRASGLSPGRLAAYLGALGLAIALVSFTLGEYVIPHTERIAHQIKVRATTGVVAQQFRSGLWAKDGGNFINIQEMLPDATLNNMRVYTFDDSFHLVSIRLAGQARWNPDGTWTLHDVVQTRIAPEGTRIERLQREQWRSDLNPDLLAVLMIPPDRMSAQALWTYIEHLRENRQRTARYEIALWNKLSFPLAAPVMLLLALPFAYYHPRNASVSGRVLVGLLLGLAFHLLNRLAGHLGLLNEWPPALSALSALALFGLGALVALWRVERS